MRKENSYLLRTVLILLQICSVLAIYENLPKIIVRDGNLILESAIDKNITVHLRGRSWLNINDIDLLKLINDFRGRAQQGITDGNEGGNHGDLANQIANIRAQIFGIHGLERRIVQLENGTRMGQANVRVRNAMRRIRRLQTKIETLLGKVAEDNCRSSPCQNGGTCVDLFDSFLCKCPENWEGTKCGVDVNECSKFAGTDLGCQNGAQCINTQGSYSCQCPVGWIGIHCTQRKADCLTSSALELCGQGTCVNTAASPGYTCICKQGWKTNGVTPACTEDVNECTEMKQPCASSCLNLPGSFTCLPCPAGFTGNGYICRDIDECSNNNGGCSNSPLVPCINSYGSYHCGECPLGWIGDGKICTRNQGVGCSRNICHPSAICREISNIVVCSCPANMTGDGVGSNGCSPKYIDPCANRCQNGGTCTANGTSYTCVCPAGLLQPNCVAPYDPCLGNPCLNGGTCVIQGNGRRYRCLCPVRYRGRRCQSAQVRCGGVLTAESGTLKYPLTTTYEHNQRCAWLIRTNVTKVLNITFNKFNLESSFSCFFDWLQIHDGGSSASQLIGRFCGSELPKGGKIISTHNKLYFWFKSDNSTSNDGFELTWESIDPVCGGELQITSHGTISSPGAPGNYPPNRDCQWHLVAPNTKRIQIMFFTMQLEAHESCGYDYLAIYDGSSTESRLLEKYCNTSHPPPFLTPSHEITLHFHSDSDNTDGGFQLHYTVVEGLPGCGGVFTRDRGEFGSPVQSGMYPHNLECDYLIKLPLDNRIKLDFIKFDLENAEHCTLDYLEIFEGTNDQAPKVGRWCGSSKPQNIVSEKNALLIRLVTDFSIAGEGFRVVYETVCGGKFEEPQGILTSPMYPNEYINDRDCEYVIDAPTGKAIILNFLDFSLEVEDRNCNYDYVEIFEGVSTTGSYKFCGHTLPPTIISKSNSLTLKLHSDESYAQRGFRANYSFIDIGCGGILKQPHMLITPPMFKEMSTESYQHNTRCEWVISAPLGFKIELSWLSFQLEDTTDCFYDFVEIYDNGTVPAEKVQHIRFCGSRKPPTFISRSNVVTIVFQSDESDTAEGFTASYHFLDSSKVCGGHYFSTSGVITSPDYPSSYPGRSRCTWVISVPAGNQIELIVKKFDLERQTICSYDYLTIRNGGKEDAPLIGTYCNQEIPSRIPSFSNQLYLQFVSDMSDSGEGFEIEWDGTTTGCGGQITTHRGTINSPNYPEPYNHNAQCDWRIVVSKGSVINIIIPQLQLESSTTCFYDYLEISEVFGQMRHKIGRYCLIENDLLHIRTTGNEAMIRFVSDASFSSSGFQLSYSTYCHKEITDMTGVIESPNFPNLYPDNLDCQWIIKGRKGSNITIHFTHVNLEFADEENGCLYDFIEISEKNEDRFELLKKICQKPNLIKSTFEEVSIKFKTDMSGRAPGFRLEFQIEGCGGTLNRPSGEIQSPGYPGRYAHNTDCEWIIVAEYGSTIELNVTDLDIETTGSCSYDGLILANGRDSKHEIVKYCGRNSTHSTSVTSNSNSMFVKFYTDASESGRGFRATYRSVPSKCGGKIKNHNGVIYSPHYPQNYEPNLNCQWLIQTDDFQTLSFRFIEFDLEEFSGDFCLDFVAIYDGKEAISDNLMLKHCGNNLPNITRNTTTSNYMLVEFVTDGDTEFKGFRLDYKTNCGQTIFANDTGILNLPYSIEAQVCIWTIKTTPDQHVTFTTTHFEARAHNMPAEISETSCDYGELTFYDGDTIESPKKSNFCFDFPTIQTSLGHALTIKLETIQVSGFGGYYSIYGNTCGGELYSFTGKFSSPLYPESYPVNVQCVWNIVATPGNILELNIEELDIEQSENCNEDYLEVRSDGPMGKVLGVFCGKDLPPKITGSSKLWIKFNSNEDEVGKGFIARYNYAHTVELVALNGTITSPRYPNILTSMESYSWRIMVPRGNVISVTFPSGLDTGVYYANQPFSMFDGYDTSAEAIELPDDVKTIVSNTNSLYITANVPHFQLDWTTIAKSDLAVNDTANSTCHEVINIDDRQFYALRSPGFPGGYDSNLNCEWIFTTEKRLTYPVLHLGLVDIDDLYGCVSDYLVVSSSSDMVSWKELLRTCKLEANQMTTLEGDPFLKVQFITDFMGNKTGFSGFVVPRCGGLLTQPMGTLTANPRDAISSPNSSDCKWQIRVRRGRKIKFVFEELSIPKGPNNNCIGYIMLKNGADDESPILGDGQYCGTKIPDDVPITTTNHAFVKYKMSFGSTVWKLRYEEVRDECGNEITLKYDSNKNTSIITSPNYPNIPNLHAECIWTIMAPAGELVQVKFDNFDLSTTPNCDKEYVEIRDGATGFSPELGLYCSQPNSIDSTSNLMRIKYFTDTSEPKTGFKATVSIGKCGGTYHSRTGIINSKNYPLPGSYPSRSTCDYRIIRPTGSAINITFIDVHLPAGNCDLEDHLSVFSVIRTSDNTSEVSELPNICGSFTTPNVVTSSNEVVIRFRTFAPNNAYRGFKITYSSSLAICGGKINAEQGIITSPGYPNGWYKRVACSWRITVPKGRRVRMEILDSDFREDNVITAWPSISMTRPRFYNDHQYLSYITNYHSPTVIYSTDNLMMLSVWLGSNADMKGFKMKFTSDEPTVCSGSFDSKNGSIPLPTWNESLYCLYDASIRTPNQTIAMKFNNIQLTSQLPMSTFTCRFRPLLAILNAMTVMSPICGNATEIIVRSPYPDTNLRLLQMPRQRRIISFNMTYKRNDCGGLVTLSAPYKITSPVVTPNPYGALDCAWHIKKLDLGSFPFSIFGTVKMKLDCDKEYLSVMDSPMGPHRGRFCGESAITNIISLHEAFIEYHSDDYQADTILNVTVQETIECGDHILAAPNSIRLGEDYKNNIECIWTIKANAGYHIVAESLDRFFIEDSQNCTKDVLEVYDFRDDDWILMDRLCGRQERIILNSTGTQLRLKFRSDSTITGDGFTIRFNRTCGGTYVVTSKAQSLSSPNYPADYDGNLNCNYTFVAPNADKMISIRIRDFDLEAIGNCRYDNVTVYTYAYDGYSQLGTYCRPYSLSELRYKNRIAFVLQTDENSHRKGFLLDYQIDNCGGNVTETKMIASPKNPQDNTYPADMQCTWNIVAPVGKQIAIKFEEFQIEISSRCYYDYVQVYEGPKIQTGRRVASLCGNLTGKIPIISINNNKAVIHFKSDADRADSGFKAWILFKDQCDEKINLNKESPSYDFDKFYGSRYTTDMNCNFVIAAPDGFNIRIEFEQFHMTPCAGNTSDTCSCDYLELRDGAGSFSELIDRYCGNELPPAITSSRNRFFVRFVSDSVGTSSGVKAKFSIVESACGQNNYELNDTKSISLQTSGETYEPNLRCLWKITASQYNIHIHFEKFDLEGTDESNACTKDVVQIYNEYSSWAYDNGLDEDVTINGQTSGVINAYTSGLTANMQGSHEYCGNHTPTDYYSNSNIVYIKLKTNDAIQKTGFKLIASSASDCIKNFTGTQGRIQLNSYSDCEFYINAPENYSISLYFHDNSAMDDNCDTQAISIFNGSTNTLLKKICGKAEPSTSFFSETNNLKVKMKKGGLFSQNDITYLASKSGPGCGGQLSNYGGIFTSPFYPMNYRNDSDCRWDIQVPNNMNVALIFDVFDLGAKSTCRSDYLQIIEFKNTGEEVVRQFCGEDKPSTYRGPSNRVAVRFRKTVNFDGTGWVIRFGAVHSDTILSQ